MDLSDYNGLQETIGEYLNRDDLTEQIPGFIQLAEAKMRRDLRRRSARASLPLAAGVGTVTLPSTVAELRVITPVTGEPHLDKPLELVTPAVLMQKRAVFTSAGRPRFYAVVGRELLLAPVPLDAYETEIVYFEALVPLSDSAPVNAVLTNAPDAYLYGALAEAEPFLEHDERVMLWKSNFDAAIAALNVQREREEYNAGMSRPAPLPYVF